MKGGLERKNLAIFLLLLFLSFLLLFLDQKNWISPVRGLMEKPVLAIEERMHVFNISISQSLNFFSYWRSGEKELMRLQGQLRQLALESGQLSACLEENEEMRRLLGAPLPPQWKFLPAKVVGISEKMRIDKGKQDGVEEGMMVVSENILVGKVVSVEERSALVQLPTDINSKIPVVVKKTGAAGVQARGILLSQSGKLIVDRILQSEDVRVGDLVMTAGEGPPRPASTRGELAEGETGWLPDLLIGQIEEVLGREAEIYKKAQVFPLIDYQSLRIVFVVTD